MERLAKEKSKDFFFYLRQKRNKKKWMYISKSNGEKLRKLFSDNIFLREALLAFSSYNVLYFQWALYFFFKTFITLITLVHHLVSPLDLNLFF